MLKLTETSLIDLTAKMFEAAADPSGSGWAEVYGTLSKICSSGAGSLYVLDKRRAEYRALADANPPGFIEEVNTKYLDMLPYRSELLSLKTGQVFQRSRAMSDADFERTDLYQQYMRHHGIFYTLHYCLYDDREMSAGLSFTRPISMDDFGPDELTALAALAPMLQRAVSLHSTVVKASEKGRLTTAGLDRLSQGMVIVDRKAKVHYANAAAEQLVSSRGGIRVSRTGTLECSTRADSEKLKALIAAAAGSFAERGENSSGAMRLRAAESEGRLAIRVTPLHRAPLSPFSTGRFAAVLISKKPRPVTDDIRLVLSDIYGLTSTEAIIAGLLGSGFSLAEICEELEITANTARTHLKRIFAKTDTNRQSSLISLILSFPSPVDLEGRNMGRGC